MKTLAQITTREARQALFQITTESADNLRRELFEVCDQDGPLPEQYEARYSAEIAAA